MRVHPSDDTLWKVLDGEAEREGAADARDHLDDCPSCVESLDEMRRLESDLRSFFESEAAQAAAVPAPLREGAVSVRSTGRVAAPAFGAIADGADFVASIETDDFRIEARSKDVRVDVAGERRRVPAGNVARIRGGNPPGEPIWFVLNSSN